jgi:hypothetical protein
VPSKIAVGEGKVVHGNACSKKSGHHVPLKRSHNSIKLTDCMMIFWQQALKEIQHLLPQDQGIRMPFEVAESDGNIVHGSTCIERS